MGRRQGALRVETLNTPVGKASQARITWERNPSRNNRNDGEARLAEQYVTLFAVELRKLLLKIGNLRQIVDLDVRAILVMFQVVLVVALRWIKGF